MSNYEEKEAQALVKIADVLNKLDASLEELSSLDEDTKKHSMKKWICWKSLCKKALAFVQQLFNFESRINRFDFF